MQTICEPGCLRKPIGLALVWIRKGSGCLTLKGMAGTMGHKCMFGKKEQEKNKEAKWVGMSWSYPGSPGLLSLGEERCINTASLMTSFLGFRGDCVLKEQADGLQFPWGYSCLSIVVNNTSKVGPIPTGGQLGQAGTTETKCP